jgi:photosystem II stability/assembly factor-like uncharacterized protein
VHEIRFANLNDGWAFGPDLWATHDGGAHWTRVSNMDSGEPVMALEAASGLVHAAVLGGGGMSIRTSPVDTDAWRASPTIVPAGAGPVPNAQLVLHDKVGWLVAVNRTVTGGARLEAGGWMPWPPPCADAGGPAVLAASTALDVVALCEEGLWNDRPQVERVYLSADGGTTFQPVANPVPMGIEEAASPAPKGVVIAGFAADATGTLIATADGGTTWKTVHREPAGGGWADLGFTNSQQGVVIRRNEQSGKLLMTVNGGSTWNPVPIQ